MSLKTVNYGRKT